MKFHELKIGDVLFYDALGHPQMGRNRGVDQVSLTHVAIVGAISDGVPWLAHVTEKGLVYNPINVVKYEYKGFAYLVYRLRYDEDVFLGTTAGSTAKFWALLNADAELHQKELTELRPETAQGTGPIDFEDSMAPAIISGEIATVGHAFSQLLPYIAALRSSSFGPGARRYIHYLTTNCVTSIPSELKRSRWPLSGMFCSMFVIAAYQTVMGETRSEQMMELDARTTLPWTMEKYLRGKISWKRHGYLDYYRGLRGNIEN